eukprot:CAMPEP_0183727958 /NCGR_PEP_ID=MMETSP0737-20130205/26838_1 /TAXON_ID=385413 /ORGANISM="Thalassiosira miniscula, Strain CCMP1093" /LENGTH=248 /DNA_ID=CAMNT_0025959745 /DNA_START=25 /DNA_END=771 /DNA_ORIENTATION=+
MTKAKAATKKRLKPTTATKKTVSSGANKIVVQRRAKVSDGPIQCWAHGRTGKRCTAKVSSREGEPIPIPYCDRHLHSGDGALKVVTHPLFGKALVARYNLPAKYRMAYWGLRGKCQTCDVEDRAISFYPPNPKTGTNIDPKVEGGRTLKLTNYNGVLNPGGTGDVIQYAACPGPNEVQNMRSTFHYYGLRNGIVGGLEFVTLRPVPKNTQLLHWYGSGWWKERGMKRADVGTKRYPAPRRLVKSKDAK